MKRPNRSDVVARDQSEPLRPNLKTEEEEPEEAEMEATLPGEKKRRLEVDQVRALEKNFDLDNKLEPERKEKLAKDLGLQPRQVAVWFQNRRARWKTKQLERDYVVLKADYDKLRLDHDSLRLQHDALLAEGEELKAEIKAKEEVQKKKTTTQESAVKVEEEETTPALLYKDASSDSDSSVILNDENSLNRFGVEDFSGLFQMPQEEEFKQGVIGMGGWDCFDGRGSKESFYYYCHQQEELLGLADNEFLVGEEACGGNIFSDEQMPSLDWYCSDQWS